MVELKSMAVENWFLFRNKIAKLDEFLDNWSQKLNDHLEHKPIDDWMKNQIDSYKVVYFS